MSIMGGIMGLIGIFIFLIIIYSIKLNNLLKISRDPVTCKDIVIEKRPSKLRIGFLYFPMFFSKYCISDFGIHFNIFCQKINFSWADIKSVMIIDNKIKLLICDHSMFLYDLDAKIIEKYGKHIIING